MKKSGIKTGSAGLIVAALFSVSALAQTAMETTTTSTTSSGTISEFSPDMVVLRSETSTEPVRYSYSKTTTVVDEAGNPVDVSVVKMGVPVQVMYVQEGDHMVARKIIVKKKVVTSDGAATGGTAVERHESTTTTTTTDK